MKPLTVAEIDQIVSDGACLPDEYAALLRMARALAVLEEHGEDVFHHRDVDGRHDGWTYWNMRAPTLLEAIEAAERAAKGDDHG